MFVRHRFCELLDEAGDNGIKIKKNIPIWPCDCDGKILIERGSPRLLCQELRRQRIHFHPSLPACLQHLLQLTWQCAWTRLECVLLKAYRNHFPGPKKPDKALPLVVKDETIPDADSPGLKSTGNYGYYYLLSCADQHVGAIIE